MLSSGLTLRDVSYLLLVQPCYNFFCGQLVIHDQQMKAILKSAGASMCPDDSDWFPTTELSAPKSLIPKFLQAKPMDYSTKKLQVSNFVGSWLKIDISLTLMAWFPYNK